MTAPLDHAGIRGRHRFGKNAPGNIPSGQCGACWLGHRCDAAQLAAALEAATKREAALREAAERVLNWADRQQPWNPAGDFDALYIATGRRRPEGEEPVGPRYYAFKGAPHPYLAADRAASVEEAT